MKTRTSQTIALFLALALVTPSAFFAAPPKAAAGIALLPGALGAGVPASISGAGVGAGAAGCAGSTLLGGGAAVAAATLAVPVSDVTVSANTASTAVTSCGGWLESIITTIQQTLTAVHGYTSMLAQVADYVYKYVLQPLAFILSGNLIKALVSATILFVIGKANGTGIPQFITDVKKSIQGVQDGQALAYLQQVSKSRSPFSYSLRSALSLDYLQASTLEGFWQANMNTLEATVPTYSDDYLTGRWEDGGWMAWFALTTKVENNPYIFNSRLKEQLISTIGPGYGGASGAKLTDANWGRGFTAWCGEVDNAGEACFANGNTPGTYDGAGQCIPSTSRSFEGQTCSNAAGDQGKVDTNGNCIVDVNADTYDPEFSSGVNPGEPCTNNDGTSGVIKTPSSVIQGTLQKVLGAQQDQIVRMGDISGEINAILSDVAKIVRTVNFARDLLGGSDNPNGLLGSAEPSSSGAQSLIEQYANNPDSYGVTSTTIASDFTNSSLGQNIGASASSDRSVRYRVAWQTIANAAQGASSSLETLISSCQDQATLASAQETATQVNQLGATAASAIIVADEYDYEVERVKEDCDHGELSCATDTAALQNLPPTEEDVINAESQARATGVAYANPDGSLNISGGTYIDMLTLITTNATALASSETCTGQQP